MATTARVQELNTPLDSRWSPRTPRTAPVSRKGTPLNASVRSTASANSYSCERQVLHPLDPDAEPDALLHYDSTDEEEGEEEFVEEGEAPKTARRLFETSSKFSELAQEIKGITLSPPASPGPAEGPTKTSPEPSESNSENEGKEEVKKETPVPGDIGVTSPPASEANSGPSSDSGATSDIARLLQQSTLSPGPDGTSDKENQRPYVASPSARSAQSSILVTPRRYKYDQYIGQLLIGSPSPSSRNQIASPNSPSDIRRNLERLRRSVQIVSERKIEMEVNQDTAIREQISKRSSISSPIQIGDQRFNEKVDRMIQRMEQEERAARERREQEEAARRAAEQRRIEAEEAEKRRKAEEEEARRRQQEEQERRNKEAQDQARREAEEARVKKEQQDAEARRQQEEQRKSAESAAAAASAAAAPSPAAPVQQAATPQTAPESNDPGRISFATRKAQMDKLLGNLAKLRKEVKANPGVLKEYNKLRRALKPKLGQFNGDQKQTLAIREFILKTFEEAKTTFPTPTVPASEFQILPPGAQTTDQVPYVYVWLLNELGKMVVDQFEAESAVSSNTATPIGICISSALARPNTGANGHSFLDIILARLWKHNAILRGELAPVNPAAPNESELVRLGYRRDDSGAWEKEEDYGNRLSGLCAGYASIASRNFTKVSLKNPHPMANLWFLFAHYMNSPIERLSNTHFFCLKTMLELSHKSLMQIYAQQGVKMVCALVGPFAEAGERIGRSGAVSLKAQGEIWRKEGVELIPKKV